MRRLVKECLGIDTHYLNNALALIQCVIKVLPDLKRVDILTLNNLIHVNKFRINFFQQMDQN